MSLWNSSNDFLRNDDFPLWYPIVIDFIELYGLALVLHVIWLIRIENAIRLVYSLQPSGPIDYVKQRGFITSEISRCLPSLSFASLFFCFFCIFFVFVAVVARRPLCIPDGKVFCPNKARQRCHRTGEKESNHTRKWCLIYCRPRRPAGRPCPIDRTKSDDILPFNSLKRDPFRPVCPSGRVPTAVVVTLKEGRTELTGNIDDERPTSPDRTWWTSSISLGLLMCPMWSKAFKRELMIIRYIKRMCTVQYIYISMNVHIYVCLCRRLSDDIHLLPIQNLGRSSFGILSIGRPSIHAHLTSCPPTYTNE